MPKPSPQDFFGDQFVTTTEAAGTPAVEEQQAPPPQESGQPTEQLQTDQAAPETAPETPQDNPQQGSDPEQGEQESLESEEQLDESTLQSFPSFDEDASEPGEAPQAKVDPEPSVQGRADDVWKQISEVMGREVKSVDDLKEVKTLTPSFEGYSQETSNLISEALDDGLLTPEDIAKGELTSGFDHNKAEDLVFDFLAEDLKLKGKEITDEIERQIEEEIAEMSQNEIRSLASNQRAKMEARATQALLKINQAKFFDEQKRRAEAEKAAEQQQRVLSGLEKKAAEMDRIPGTDVMINDKMRSEALRIAKEALSLPQNSILRQLLGNPGSGSEVVAISQALRLRYAQQIQKVSLSRGRNEGVRQAIQNSTSSQQEAPPPGTSIPGNGEAPWKQKAEQSLDDFFSGKSTLPRRR